MPTGNQSEEADVKKVFDAWKKHRPNPEAVKLTESRRKTIRARLADGYTADQLALVVGDYAHLADTPEAAFWRGDNPQGVEYLDIAMNLLRPQKIAKRVENALKWKMGQNPQAGGENYPDVPDVNLGFMADFAGLPRGRVEEPNFMVPRRLPVEVRPKVETQPVVISSRRRKI